MPQHRLPLIVVGDPINGKLFVAMSFDAGDTWQVMPKPESKDDVRWVSDTEAMFASSGTNVKLTSWNDYSPTLLVTGGSKARLKDLTLHNFNDSLVMMQVVHQQVPILLMYSMQPNLLLL